MTFLVWVYTAQQNIARSQDSTTVSFRLSYLHPLPDDLTAMADMFEGIQSLPHPLPGVPNFRRVPSYKVTN